MINTYCWITYTFTLPGQHGKLVGTEVAQSGLGNDNQEKIFHSYYQWVPFTLFFQVSTDIIHLSKILIFDNSLIYLNYYLQGCLFYVPHWIWKNWEDGKVSMISQGIRGMFALPQKERANRQKRLINYIVESLRTHNGYSFGYFFCEILNLVNVIANIIFVDRFLGGTFLTYGTDVIHFSNMNQENRSDPMVEIFPRITKCTFHKYGSSGSIQKHDALCVLALNILNEKIYIFLWFWFIILAGLSVCAIIYSALVVMLPTTREAIIKRRFRNGTTNEVEGLISNIQVRFVSNEYIKMIGYGKFK